MKNNTINYVFWSIIVSFALILLFLLWQKYGKPLLAPKTEQAPPSIVPQNNPIWGTGTYSTPYTPPIIGPTLPK